MNIRNIIQVGNIVRYKNKQYLVIDYDFLYGGNIMRVSLIRLNTGWNPKFKWIKEIYDEEIEKLEIFK